MDLATSHHPNSCRELSIASLARPSSWQPFVPTVGCNPTLETPSISTLPRSPRCFLLPTSYEPSLDLVFPKKKTRPPRERNGRESDVARHKQSARIFDQLTNHPSRPSPNGGLSLHAAPWHTQLVSWNCKPRLTRLFPPVRYPPSCLDDRCAPITKYRRRQESQFLASPSRLLPRPKWVRQRRRPFAGWRSSADGR